MERIFKKGEAMNYEKELDFMLDVFKKRRISYAITTPFSPLCEILPPELIELVGQTVSPSLTISEVTKGIEERTLYKTQNLMHLSFIFLKLSEQKNEILIIGPYLREKATESELFELGERTGVSPKSQKYLEEYYHRVPVIKETDTLFLLINSFCERIWETSRFAISDTDIKDSVGGVVNREMTESFEDAIVNIKVVEKRYAFENELIDAVRHGLLQKEAQLLAGFSTNLFEKRLDDHIRNAKNYAIIMNTILRKAAEEGGVHPIHLDKISSEYATKIETLSSITETPELMREMFRGYCRLVRKMTIKDYSPVVQKTILIIDYDPSADLSLHALAKEQSVSAGYLSAVFKRETGVTLSQYIRDRRIKLAERLLKTTHLQVQTVSLRCGIMDVQYFCKLFKAATGKTPKEYREEG